MPKRNRVDPFGEFHAVAQRGTLMGNRGCLHSPTGEILQTFKRKEWVTCLLEFRGRRRTVMEPGRYTELFFLDEATSFAAGHRPCGTCRREALSRFRAAWAQSDADPGVEGTDLKRVDAVLHSQRLGLEKHSTALSNLPDGVFVQMEASQGAWLWWRNRLLEWSFDGYRQVSTVRAGDREAKVLTPASLVEVLRAGYPVAVHPSVGR